jgi:hypothetical protein
MTVTPLTSPRDFATAANAFESPEGFSQICAISAHASDATIVARQLRTLKSPISGV